ncbi:hypothetical protein E4T49_01293 [Aureobasidium sp. EXF-10728]|nr:hypothetical protein E4T49_01293 [Aureobasidium sp. EXF-10728]
MWRFEGRRKKKKCDLTKPTCERCRNSYGQDQCVWSDGQKRTRVRREIKPSQEPETQPLPSSPDSPTNDTSSLSRLETTTEPIGTPDTKYPMDLGFENFCSWRIPDVVANISPFLTSKQALTSRSDLSPQAFLKISAAFQNQILCLDSDFKDSIVVHSLPLALEHPTLLHAWVACSIIALSRSMPYWHEKAIRHYDSAVSGLSQALQEGSQTNDKWKRETVLLLHLFEGFQSKDEESALGKAHLRGAHELFIPTVKDQCPMGYHDVLVLEAYIMHTANNHLFQPDSQLPITHITEALGTLTSALNQLKMDCNWRSSPWIGFGGPELADMAYRVSWLTHKPFLNDQDNKEVEELISRLSSWTAPACQEESLSTHLDLPPKRLVLLARAYWCACSYLATHLAQEQNCILPFDADAFVTEIIQLLNQLIEHEHTINNHLWPLVVIGTAATDPATQEHIRSLLPQFHQGLGPASLRRAERFLAVAWETDSQGMMYGRKIFKNREALYQMFF